MSESLDARRWAGVLVLTSSAQDPDGDLIKGRNLGKKFDIWICSACSAVIQREDDDGVIGVKIGKELMKCAGKALTANITQLGPLVLPISEQLIFAGNFVARKVRCPP